MNHIIQLLLCCLIRAASHKRMEKNDEADGPVKLLIIYVKNLNYQKLSGSPYLKY